jgi:hypothetical protein
VESTIALEGGRKEWVSLDAVAWVKSTSGAEKKWSDEEN